MSDRITSLIPMARSVTLAGRAFLVHECRISDLADLQAALETGWPDPIEMAGPRAFDESVDPDERERILDATETAWEEPPTWGSDSANRYFASDEGAALLLWVMLRRGTPKLTPEKAATLLLKAEPGEIARVRRIFFAVDSISVVRKANPLMKGLFDATPGTNTPWRMAIDELSRERHWSYRTIYGLTLTEFRNARSNGDPRDDAEMTWAAYTTWINRRNAKIAESQTVAQTHDPEVNDG